MDPVCIRLLNGNTFNDCILCQSFCFRCSSVYYGVVDMALGSHCTHVLWRSLLYEIQSDTSSTQASASFYGCALCISAHEYWRKSFLQFILEPEAIQHPLCLAIPLPYCYAGCCWHNAPITENTDVYILCADTCTAASSQDPCNVFKLLCPRFLWKWAERDAHTHGKNDTHIHTLTHTKTH